jgi:hypothetical protein
MVSSLSFIDVRMGFHANFLRMKSNNENVTSIQNTRPMAGVTNSMFLIFSFLKNNGCPPGRATDLD